MAHNRKLVGPLFPMWPLTETQVYLWISYCVLARWNGRIYYAPRLAIPAPGGLGMPLGQSALLEAVAPGLDWLPGDTILSLRRGGRHRVICCIPSSSLMGRNPEGNPTEHGNDERRNTQYLYR